MNRLLLALLLAAACKHSTSSSSTSHTETSTVTDSTSSESGAVTTTTTVSEAPGETTTTTEEYAPPEEVMPSESDESGGLRTGADGGVPATPGVVKRTVRHGPLVKRTVTVTKSGGETTQTRQEATQTAQGATETKAAGKSDVQTKAQTASAPAASCVSLGWLWGLVILAVVFVAWRLLRKV